MNTLREWAHVWVWFWRHLTKKYPQSEADRLVRWLPKSCVCIDVGAHSGVWSVPLSRFVPQGEVVAFEAFPHYARVLRRTLWLLGCRNVQVINQAVCNAETPVNLVWKNSQGKRLTGLTHVLGPQEGAASTITVPGTTLDAIFSSRPGTIKFVKMDIEGAELVALQGARQLFAQHRPIVYTELNALHCVRYRYQPSDIFQFFSSRNYQGFVPGQDNSLEAVDATKYGESKMQDVWFVPEEEVTAFEQAQAR